MRDIPYNSRETYHKSPFGAVAAGTGVLFRIVLPVDLHTVRVWLALRPDNAGDAQMIPLLRESRQDKSREWWRGEYAPAGQGLYFYHFEIETPHERKNISSAGAGLGEIGSLCRDWQLTVFNPAYTTPDWLKGGVIYQIFPDRFCNSGRQKQAVPADRILRADWGGEPLWEPDERGNIHRYDYFGGDLAGIAAKLPRLACLGVTCIYLNPVFEAHSNHRYDTADYLKIDPLLGSEDDFKQLCAQASAHGIRIILDGVFSHTGADSLYFNKNRRYPGSGAYNSKESPYYSWYKFNCWPDDYKSWWNIEILPEINEDNPQFSAFITGENGVARKWLRAGASGWRLDVADELPDAFLESFRAAVKSEKPDAFILGEVWEDASNKYSYGSRRRYLQGSQLDSVMNYPFANALIDFILTGAAGIFGERVLEILENYPPQAVHTLMNHIGTHDTVRALTLFAGGAPADSCGTRAAAKLTGQQREKGLALLKIAAAVQYTLPGVPCVYYGDEAGLEGGRDPFNRGCYPWGGEEPGLLEHYEVLGKIRKTCPALIDGSFEPIIARDGCFAFARSGRNNAVLTIANISGQAVEFVPGSLWREPTVLLGSVSVRGGSILAEAMTAAVLTV